MKGECLALIRLMAVAAAFSLVSGCSDPAEDLIERRAKSFAMQPLSISEDDILSFEIYDAEYIKSGNTLNYSATGRIEHRTSGKDFCKEFSSKDSGKFGVTGGFDAFVVTGECS